MVWAGFFVLCCGFKPTVGDGLEAPLEVHVEQELDSGVLTCPVEKFSFWWKIQRKYMWFLRKFLWPSSWTWSLMQLVSIYEENWVKHKLKNLGYFWTWQYIMWHFGSMSSFQLSHKGDFLQTALFPLACIISVIWVWCFDFIYFKWRMYGTAQSFPVLLLQTLHVFLSQLLGKFKYFQVSTGNLMM